MIRSWENVVTDGQTDGQMNRQSDESDFIGRCPFNVEHEIFFLFCKINLIWKPIKSFEILNAQSVLHQSIQWLPQIDRGWNNIVEGMLKKSSKINNRRGTIIWYSTVLIIGKINVYLRFLFPPRIIFNNPTKGSNQHSLKSLILKESVSVTLRIMYTAFLRSCQKCQVS